MWDYLDLLLENIRCHISQVRSLGLLDPTRHHRHSVIFSNDGSYLIAMFDSPTNRGNMSATFPCSLLFQFACARTSLCQWINDTTAYAYIIGSSCVLPNDMFTVSENAIIRPFCQVMRPCSTWPKALPSSVNIRRPILPVKPSVVISSPYIIGARM